MSYRSYICKEAAARHFGMETLEKQAELVLAMSETKEVTGMDQLISETKRDEVPRKRSADGTSNALLPKVVWPDVWPSLRSRLMDRLILLSGRRKWWASAAVVQERARKLALRPAPHRPVRLGRNVQVDLRFEEGWPIYDVTPARSGGTRQHFVFLHGGG